MKDEQKSKSFKRHDPTCYQLTRDIVIPAGTMLRATGDGVFSAAVGANAELILSAGPSDMPGGFRRVVAP